ncbi:amino acid ABC transporter permease [Desulfolucanica intricata]|uniref:amino acid ABC transporter permease n=1 Tax=Desulfolucanica intricata TaxID=1285191 RepID=UPI00082F9D11|nr:amino acid ABC transporter permease [Desulfolucanica intricata]
MQGFDFAFAVKILPVLLQGAVMTIELTVLAIIFGTVIGLIIALAKISNFKLFQVLGGIYTWVIRGIPLLMQLFILYYALPEIGIKLSPFGAAVIGLSICGGAYIAEIIRAGILSIDKGQMEAALSLGMSYTQAMRRIILPQAYRRLLPPMSNEFITLMKDTALVSSIAMVELMRSANHLSSTYFKPMEAYMTAALLYLLLTTVFTVVFDKMERRLAVTEEN